jgi:hypothetical protein
MAYRFLPDRIHKELIANSRYNASSCRRLFPVVKLFSPDANAVWLFTKVLRNNFNVAYGLIDIGQGNPHLGYVDLQLLSTARGRMGLPVERDLNFAPDYDLWVYEVASSFDGVYSEDPDLLAGIFKLQIIQPKIIYPKPSLN